MNLSVALVITALASPIGTMGGVGGKPGKNNAGAGSETVAKAPITALRIAPDGKTAVSGSAKGELRRYTLTDELVWAPAGKLGGSVTAVVFDLNGVAYAADDAGAVARLQVGKQAVPFAAHAGGVRSLAVTPDGECLLTGGVDGVVRLWNAVGGAKLGEFDAHSGLPVTGLVFAKDRLWSVGWDRTLRGWKLSVPKAGKTRPRCAKQKVKLPAGAREVTSLATDGTRLLSAGWDGSLRLWDLSKRKPRPLELPLRTHQEWAAGPVFSKDGSRALAVAAAEGGLVLIDRLSEPVQQLRKRAPIPSCVEFSGDRILVGSFDGTVAWGEIPAPPTKSPTEDAK
jgi:WD40 repeat protein